MTAFKRTIRRLAKEDSGSELMEAAAIFPLLFMAFIGIFWAGQAFSMYGTITRAAQEGARAGAAPYCTTCATGNSPAQNAYNSVKAAMTLAKLDITNANNPIPPPSLVLCSDGTTPVGCDNTVTNVCVQQPVQITTPAAGVPGVCGISVSYTYPFQMSLPFASVSQQLILLKAQARVRIETQ